MEFIDFLKRAQVASEDGHKNMTVYPWMSEVRKYDNVLAKAARRVGITTYISMSALYDILYDRFDNVTIVTYHGGYRKRHFIDSLYTYYSWMMQEFNMEKRGIRVSDSGLYISGKGSIEIYGLHECATRFRGHTKPTNKLYGDLFMSEDIDQVMGLMVHAIDNSALFFQGLTENCRINQIYNNNDGLSDMDKTLKVLKEEFFWHTISIPHNLTSEQEESMRLMLGEERFKVEFMPQ